MVATLAFLVGTAWLFRYQVVGTSPAVAYLHDRWTGNVYFVVQETKQLVQESLR